MVPRQTHITAVVLAMTVLASWASAQVQWSTTVDGQSWTPGIEVTVEAYDVVQVVDTFVNNTGGGLPVQLVQDFNPTEIGYVDASASAGSVSSSSGHVEWSVTIPPGGSASLTLLVSAQTCSWPQSLLHRVWLGTGQTRDVGFVKWLADLQLGSVHEPMVFSGQQAVFTLQYSNSGGYENAVQVWCEFPADATFASSSPPADFVDPGGLGAGWLTGDLANGSSGTIDVTIDVAPDLPIPTPFVVLCAVHDHTGAVAQQVVIDFVTASRVLWDRTVDGQQWFPGMVVEGETCDTIEIVEAVDNRSAGAAPVQLAQHFESAEIGFVDTVASDGVVTVSPGVVEWTVEIGAGDVETLVTALHLDPCTWTESPVTAFLSEGDQWSEFSVFKAAALLWLEARFEPEVVAGRPAMFEVDYGNDGGYENDVEFWCDFPANARYATSTPPADYVDPSGLGAGWLLGDLGGGGSGSIAVTVDVDAGLEPGTSILIVCDLIDHADVVAATAVIELVTVDPTAIFADGFESGDTTAWSAAVP